MLRGSTDTIWMRYAKSSSSHCRIAHRVPTLKVRVVWTCFDECPWLFFDLAGGDSMRSRRFIAAQQSGGS